MALNIFFQSTFKIYKELTPPLKHWAALPFKSPKALSKYIRDTHSSPPQIGFKHLPVMIEVQDVDTSFRYFLDRYF